MTLRRADASSRLWPPDRKLAERMATGMQRRNTSMLACENGKVDARGHVRYVLYNASKGVPGGMNTIELRYPSYVAAGGNLLVLWQS